MVLIEKEWVQFGHQFYVRLGHGIKNNKEKERCPIFLQFLDCVYQLLLQFPAYFEFTCQLLVDINYHSYACIFGTFLGNNYKEILERNLQKKTVSLWSYILSQKYKYINRQYNPQKDSVLKPNSSPKQIAIWSEYFLYYSHLYKGCTKPSMLFHQETIAKEYEKWKAEMEGKEKENGSIEDVDNGKPFSPTHLGTNGASFTQNSK